MEYIFSEEGIAKIEWFKRQTVLYGFDFDGTLAQIVPFPNAAWMRPTVRALLADLTQHRYVAVISGRSLEDLRRRINLESILAIGNHGIESDVKAYSSQRKLAEQVCNQWECDLKSYLSVSPVGASVDIENKCYSLSVHYRRSNNYAVCRTEIMKIIHRLRPQPRAVNGKAVINLLTLGAPHKGDALTDAIEKMKVSHAVFVGDDLTDEDVFFYAHENVLTIRVGYDACSAAKYYLRDQSEIEKLLLALIG